MSVLARSLLAAAFAACAPGVASAQLYVEAAPEPMVEWSSPAPGWSGAGYDRRVYRSAPVRRIATPHVMTRAYSAPALPAMNPVAYTAPTRVIYAEPIPRTAYYNEPIIIDGLRTHRSARRVAVDPCGYGCVRSAY